MPFSLFFSNDLEIYSPGIIFNEMNISERVHLSSQEPDLDFFAFSGLPADILQSSVLQNFLQLQSCQIVEKAYLKQIYSTVKSGAIIVGSIGDYLVGVMCSMRKGSQHAASTQLAADLVTIGIINARLLGCSKKKCIYSLFCSTICSIFAEFTVVVFCHGQKQALSLFADRLKLLAAVPGGTLEIALGVEYSLSESFICLKAMQEYFGIAYSNFLSSTGCNLLQKNAQQAGEVIAGAYRACIYNTLQHLKKDTHCLLSSQAVLGIPTALGNLSTSIEAAIQAVCRLATALDDNRLRVEGYFVLQNAEQLDISVDALQNALSSRPLVYASISTIAAFI